jgi:hypothetical protein
MVGCLDNIVSYFPLEFEKKVFELQELQQIQRLHELTVAEEHKRIELSKSVFEFNKQLVSTAVYIDIVLT